MQIFISYSHKDTEYVQKLAQSLKKHDVNVWLDDWQITPGDSLIEALEKGIRESDIIVTILSPENANNPNTYFEVGAAYGLGKKIIPIVLEGLENQNIPFGLRKIKYLTQDDPEENARQVAEVIKKNT